MTILLLSIATLFTLLTAYLTLGVKLPGGPDRAGLGLLYPIVTFPRWASLAVLFWLLVNQGAFSWIASSRVLQFGAVMLAHVIMGITVLIATAAVHEGHTSPTNLALAFAVPCLVILYAATLSYPQALPAAAATILRVTTIAAFAVCTLVSATQYYSYQQQESARQSAHSANEAARDTEYYQERRIIFDALPPSAPLTDLLPFTVGEPGDIPAQATVRILSLPDFSAQLEQALTSQWVIESLVFVRNIPEPNPALAPLAARGIETLAALWEKKLVTGSYDDRDLPQNQRLAESVAACFPGHTALFKPPLAHLADVARRMPVR